MSQNIKLYTMNPMLEAVVDSMTPAPDAGFEKEHLIDGNPDTYTVQSSATEPVIDIDLQSAQTIDAVGFWIQNNNTDFSGEYNYQFKHSTDGSTYFAATSILPINNSIGLPLFVVDLTSGLSRRYWRLLLTDFDDTPSPYIQLSWIFLLEEHDLGQGEEYPINDSFTYHGRLLKGAGGRTYSKSINSAIQIKYRRQFIFNNTSNYAELVTAFSASRGSDLPMILNLDGVNAGAVRFVGDFPVNNVENAQYRPLITLESIPFIPDGAIL